MTNPIQRTTKQNSSLHKYCTEVAQLLNESGISKEVFYRNIQADYTMENIKELWRSFARTKYGKGSTKDLTTVEIQNIFEEVNRHISQFGVYVVWPSQDFNNLIESYEN